MHLRIARPVLGDFDRPFGNEVAKPCPVSGEMIWATPDDELEEYRRTHLEKGEPLLQISMFSASLYDITPSEAGFDIFMEFLDIEHDMEKNDPEHLDFLYADEEYCLRHKIAEMIVRRAMEEGIL